MRGDLRKRAPQRVDRIRLANDERVQPKAPHASDGRALPAGAVVGKALNALESGQAVVPMLVTLR